MKTRRRNKTAKNHLRKTRSKKHGGANENPSIKLQNGVLGNNSKMVEEALNEGADVNVTDAYDNTALLIAVIKERPDSDIIKLLLENGANINKANITGETILMGAINYGNEEVMEQLLAYAHIEVNARNNDGETALIRAVEYGNSEIVTTLVEAGADMNIRDNYGNTPLIRASMIREEYILEVLLYLGSDVNAQNNARETALIVASRLGHYLIVKWLLRLEDEEEEDGTYMYETDVNVVDANGNTALMVARQSGHDAIAELLWNAGADDEPSANLHPPTCMTEAEYKKCEIPDFHEENEKGWTKDQWETDKKPECSISTEEIEIEDAVKFPTQPTKCFQRAALRQWLNPTGFLYSNTNPLDREPVEESWIVANMGDQPCEPPMTEGGKRKSKRKTRKTGSNRLKGGPKQKSKRKTKRKTKRKPIK